jgi:hypothetical protein
MDHGYAVNEDKRCAATSQKARPCANQALTGIDRCALHAGLAKPRGAPGYGDPRALEDYKRRRLAPQGPRPQAGDGGSRQTAGRPR